MGRNTQGAEKLINLAEIYGAAMIMSEHRKKPEDVAIDALQYASAMMGASNAIMRDARQRDEAKDGGQIDKADADDDWQPLQYQEQTREDLQREADALTKTDPHASEALVPDTERPPVDTGEVTN